MLPALTFLQKGRFRLLKTGLRIRDKQVLNHIVRTCAALHNQLLDIDGLKCWESGGAAESDWLGDMGNFEAQDVPKVFGAYRGIVQPAPNVDLGKVAAKFAPRRVLGARSTSTHAELQQRLFDHFNHCAQLPVSDSHSLKWPRRNGAVPYLSGPVGKRLNQLQSE